MEKVVLPEARYEFGGDEHVLVVFDEAMSLEVNFKVQAVTRELRAQKIKGITEICPGNASYMVRIDPDVLKPQDAVQVLKEIEETIAPRLDAYRIQTRLVDIPILYDDPWSRECARRFADRHQAPDKTNLEFVMELNGFKTKEEFIAAHSGTPYLISMVGFVPGTAWSYQMVQRERQIEVPKYVRPRTFTPARCFSHGGAFACIYPVDGPGGYQMFGMSAVPVYDPEGKLEELRENLILAKHGDIWKYRPIDLDEYNEIQAEVEEGRYQYRVQPVEFALSEFNSTPNQYLTQLMEGLYGAQGR